MQRAVTELPSTVAKDIQSDQHVEGSAPNIVLGSDGRILDEGESTNATTNKDNK